MKLNDIRSARPSLVILLIVLFGIVSLCSNCDSRRLRLVYIAKKDILKNYRIGETDFFTSLGWVAEEDFSEALPKGQFVVGTICEGQRISAGDVSMRLNGFKADTVLLPVELSRAAIFSLDEGDGIRLSYNGMKFPEEDCAVNGFIVVRIDTVGENNTALLAVPNHQLHDTLLTLGPKAIIWCLLL
jgi:hypothetical protein